MITTETRIAAILASLILLGLIIELVRRRRLKEEYSVLWTVISIVLLVLAAWTGLLHDLTRAIGAESESSTLYFFGILLGVLMLLHFSVRVSLLERRVTVLLQEIAVLRAIKPDALHGDATPAAAPSPVERRVA